MMDFHCSRAPIRVVSGAHRIGKSTRGAWESVCLATGYHPYRKERYPVPNVGWVVTLDEKNYGHIAKARLEEWLPRGTEWIASKSMFQLPKPWGSKIYMKTAEAGGSKFEAEGILWAWFDEGFKAMEEPWSATGARIRPGWPLIRFMTMTPQEGRGGWTWRKLLDPNSQERYPGVEVFELTIYDAHVSRGGHLTDENIAHMIAQFDEYEREARVYGRPGMLYNKPYFRKDRIDEAQKRCDAVKRGKFTVDAVRKTTFEDDAAGDVYMLRPPVAGRPYVMPIDTGGGVGRDYTVAAILDPVDGAECAYFKSNRMDPDQAVKHRIYWLGKHYNFAKAVPESNGEHGMATLLALRGLRYPRIYREKVWNSTVGGYKDRFGWRTTDRGSRNAVYDAMAERLRDGKTTFSPDCLDEMTFIGADVDGRPDHAPGLNDDHFFTVGIGWAAVGLQPGLGRRSAPRQQPKWIDEGEPCWAA